MPDNLIDQHRRLAMGEDIGVEPIENPFKQVTNVDKADGKKALMGDGNRRQKFTKYQG